MPAVTFEGSGTFKDRAAFRKALEEKLEGLKGRLPGEPRETRTEEGGEERILWEYMGARFEVAVRAADWSYEVEIPPYLPIPSRDVQSMVEGQFAGLDRF